MAKSGAIKSDGKDGSSRLYFPSSQTRWTAVSFSYINGTLFNAWQSLVTTVTDNATVVPEVGFRSRQCPAWVEQPGTNTSLGPPVGPSPHVLRAAVFSWHCFPTLNPALSPEDTSQNTDAQNSGSESLTKRPSGDWKKDLLGHTSAWSSGQLVYVVAFQRCSSCWEIAGCVSQCLC